MATLRHTQSRVSLYLLLSGEGSFLCIDHLRLQLLNLEKPERVAFMFDLFDVSSLFFSPHLPITHISVDKRSLSGEMSSLTVFLSGIRPDLAQHASVSILNVHVKSAWKAFFQKGPRYPSGFVM